MTDKIKWDSGSDVGSPVGDAKYLKLDASNDPITADLDIHGITVGRGGGSDEYSSYNTAVGKDALAANTVGYANVAVGFGALIANTEGNYDVAVGGFALGANTVGVFNTAVGASALKENVEGDHNVAVGGYALYYNLGDDNTAIGTQTLSNNTTGYRNVAIGGGAGNKIVGPPEPNGLQTAHDSVYIGAGARGLNNSDDNAIVIGSEAMGMGANTVVLGNASITDTYLRGVLRTAVQAMHKVFIGPVSGADAAPNFRVLVAADIPALAYEASGAVIMAIARGWFL